MPRYSNAYSMLTERLEEVKTISASAKKTERGKLLGKNAKLISALCRGGVVLLSSHIEGYIVDLNELMLESIINKKVKKNKINKGFRYYHSRDLIDNLLKIDDFEKSANVVSALFERDGFIWNDHPEFIGSFDNRRFMKGFSTPKPEKIYALFRRYGHENLRRDIQVSLKRDFAFHQTNVLALVDLRNNIAHGDLNATQTPDDLMRLCNSTKIFCREIDISICNWCTDNKFTIR